LLQWRSTSLPRAGGTRQCHTAPSHISSEARACTSSVIEAAMSGATSLGHNNHRTRQIHSPLITEGNHVTLVISFHLDLSKRAVSGGPSYCMPSACCLWHAIQLHHKRHSTQQCDSKHGR
jgi:hypothetical protein